jgi:ribosomal protein L37AE/L43A
MITRLKEIFNFKFKPEVNHQHTCECCKQPVKSFGAIIHGIPFCQDCRVNYKHFAYFEGLGFDNYQLYTLKETEI